MGIILVPLAIWLPLTCALVVGVVGYLYPPIAPLAVVACVLFLLDAKARGQEFLRLRKFFLRAKPIASLQKFERLMIEYRVSRCGRCAMSWAMASAGWGDHAFNYYRACGYRWYHVFPDYTLDWPSPWLSVSHWRKVLGV